MERFENTYMLNHIKPDIDAERLGKKLRLKKGSPQEETFFSMVDEFIGLDHARGIYRSIMKVQGAEGFNNKFYGFLSKMQLNIPEDEDQMIFPYAITLGHRVDEWCSSFRNVFRQYIAGCIAKQALNGAVEEVKAHIILHYGIPHLSVLMPGSRKDIPVETIAQIFDLLDNMEKKIGISLTGNTMMTPLRSLSGIIYPAVNPLSTYKKPDNDVVLF